MRIPPVQIYSGSVIEYVQIVSPCLTPLNARLWRLESFILDLHVPILARLTDIWLRFAGVVPGLS
jgi:hypothetical protein